MDTLVEFLIVVFILTIALFFGLIGNFLGLILFYKKNNLSSICPLIIYKALFFIDTITLVQVVTHFMKFSLSIDIFIFSPIICKSVNFLGLWTPAISPFLLVYVSIDRLIAIRFLNRVRLLRNLKNQYIFVFFSIIFNFVFNIPSIIGLDVQYGENQTYFCEFVSFEYQEVVAYTDLVNRCLIPFILMTVFSLTLIICIFKSRLRVMRDGLVAENRLLKKDIKFSITSIMLNVYFLLCNLPVSIYTAIPSLIFWSSYGFELSIYILFLGSFGNFYILFFTNSIIRKKFYSIFKKSR